MVRAEGIKALSPMGKASAGKSPALMSKSETLNKKEKNMYTVIYVKNGLTFTEKRNGLCYAKMLAEHHNGKVFKGEGLVWG